MEVVYYWNEQTHSWKWDNNPDRWVNNILTSFASTASDDDLQMLTYHTCPGIELGTITKVEVRVYAYGDGDDRIDLQLDYALGVKGNWYETTPDSIPNWGVWVDVTNDPNHYPWTFAAIANHLYLACEYDKVKGGAMMYGAKAEFRITYTPSAGYYHGLKVQGVGELALCDVGTNPLRIRKGGTTYGIELVATDDPNASAVRIKTGAGIKAIRRYT